MKAIRLVRYGGPDLLELGEVEVPELLPDRVLVRMKASSVNAMDWHEMRGEPLPMRLVNGVRRPKSQLLGGDVAGVVEQVGSEVTEFKPGDEVFGVTAGAFAEVVRLRRDRLVAKPTTVTFEQAAAVPVASTTALQAVRDQARIERGQRALIIGAGGGVGSFALQIAKARGAHVTAVSNAANHELLQSLGADEVLDYAAGDFLAGQPPFDAIVDVSGTRSIRALRRALTPTGTFVMVGGPGGRWIRPLQRSALVWLTNKLARRQQFRFFLARVTLEDLEQIRSMLEDGSIKPVIDRTFPLDETREAIAYQERGQARGKVIITG